MELYAHQEQFLSTPAYFAIGGGAAGSGKTHSLLLDPLRHCVGDTSLDGFDAVIFRKTYTDAKQAGGLWEAAQEMYLPFGAKPNQSEMSLRFPSGAQVRMGHLETDKHKLSYQGAALAVIYFDELTHFSEELVFYLTSRNRTTCGMNPYIRATCNPDAGSWVASFIEWWIDQNTGYPIAERSGKIRWYKRNSETNEFFWLDDPECEAAQRLAESRDAWRVPLDSTEHDAGHTNAAPLHALAAIPPLLPQAWYRRIGETLVAFPNAAEAAGYKSATFIPGLLEDNLAVMSSNPEYYDTLDNLQRHERERLLKGNWLASNDDGSEWPREYFVDVAVESIPYDRCTRCLIGVDASKGKTDSSDYSAIVAAYVDPVAELIYIDSSIERRNPNAIVEDLFAFCERNHPDLIGIETLQFQELFLTLIAHYARENPSMFLSRYLQAHNDIIGIEDMKNKRFRIRRLSSHITNRRLRFLKNKSTRILLDQARQFPDPKAHDDGLDALDMALQLPLLAGG